MAAEPLRERRWAQLIRPSTGLAARPTPCGSTNAYGPCWADELVSTPPGSRAGWKRPSSTSDRRRRRRRTTTARSSPRRLRGGPGVAVGERHVCVHRRGGLHWFVPPVGGPLPAIVGGTSAPDPSRGGRSWGVGGRHPGGRVVPGIWRRRGGGGRGLRGGPAGLGGLSLAGGGTAASAHGRAHRGGRPHPERATTRPWRCTWRPGWPRLVTAGRS